LPGRDEFVTRPSARDHLQRLIRPARDDVLFGICTVLEAFQVSAAYPLLLAFLERGIRDAEWHDVASVLESYIVRRAVFFPHKQIDGRAFLSLTGDLRDGKASATHLKALLLALSDDAWPDDGDFRKAWLHEPLYGPLTQAQLVHIFVRLNEAVADQPSLPPDPALEHIMPQNWQMHWSLPGGDQGLSPSELGLAQQSDPRAIATRERELAIQTLGNLTILSAPLSLAQSNQPWNQKRPEMMKHSLLPINQSLWRQTHWDEGAIEKRGEELFAIAVRAWPR
jgi:hypothetical protein